MNPKKQSKKVINRVKSAETDHPARKKSTEQYEQQIGELTLHLQRLQAEFENYKKREASQRLELMDNAKQAVLAELLPALDNFDRAATHLPTNLEDNAWAKGMQYVGQQMLEILDGMGVSRFDPKGEMFDPAMHDAVEHIVSDKPGETIVEVIIPGYKIGDKVVRPAQVKVSSGPENPPNSKKDKVIKGDKNE